MTPKRIQRKRTKGWRMPEGAVFVGRPSRWGSPYRVGDYAFLADKAPYPAATAEELWEASPAGLHAERITDVAKTVRWYRAWYLATMIDRPYYGVNELRGKDLVCWCPLDQPCHADVLLELANA